MSDMMLNYLGIGGFVWLAWVAFETRDGRVSSALEIPSVILGWPIFVAYLAIAAVGCFIASSIRGLRDL